MYKEILKLLKCPKCGADLTISVKHEEDDEIIEGSLCCSCGQSYAVKEGVINFGSTEQEFANNWTESYKESDYEEVDNQVLEATPQNTRKLNEKAKQFMISKINAEKPEFLLDIATGRGMLFTEMVKNLQCNTHIICADLSYEVLKYDRLKAKNINPSVKVDYIACDATKLPLKDNVIDFAESFYGIANMYNITDKGVNEAYRVLKQSCSFLNAFVVIKEESNGYKAAQKIFKEDNMAGGERFLLKPEIEKCHDDTGFEKADIVTVGESIGEKCDTDLIQAQGEWFAVIIADCRK